MCIFVKTCFKEREWSMDYDVLALSYAREVTLCGINLYPNPEYHPDRIMDEHDLLYIQEGEWKVGQDETVYTLKAGDAIFLRAGSHHFGPARCSINTHTLFIHFNRLPDDRSRQKLSTAETHACAAGAAMCIPTVVHCGLYNTFFNLLMDVINTYWTHRDDRKRKLSILLNLLFNELSFIARSQVPDTEDWIASLISLFRNDPSRFYSLPEASALVKIAERSLSERFRKVMGTSLRQYQVDIKLEMAYDDLINGSITIKEAADKYGFCDPYHFSRVFKKKYNVSPKEIKHRNPSQNINRPWMG